MVERIWRTYHKQLLSFIQKRVSDPVLAEDILQEVFIKIHSKIDSLQEGKKIKAWLFQITRNTIIDYYRKSNKNEGFDTQNLDLEDENNAEAMADIQSCIVPMIKSLPDDYRDALLLSELNGLSQKELSEKLQISYSAAKSRVQRGRSMLKEALSQCCSFEKDSKGRIIDYEKKVSSCDNCREN
ncbi:RNA polymerase sigma factor SigZ [Marinifilum caeruleilacunae]|uniref:RNA polymerase sigma factor SigZ n=1 Tax=Marinifilum caeruleilacunae TaxID=2499076 RepID=A0ABX1WST4_9BACT|nr:RNA polymerase sigma factor SigZ [Marinifilum caeruleilacunae]NOU59170.1 RNA polymerase sigma factor SigZ [Marinifilum caeruleilacunae]